ncbi:DNA (cytosine-5-)-methyltransferase [Cytobacillus oceanisediminis]|uniref:DNA (cytosine-5-)-methyltransferase n=1 Tax=Cytobacillus oceanisediminis TaxID=665099 RepID=UPI00207A4C8C|nr:DNA (cytosine-5-)-methyltransferase [Cytobacillus oceanisediminis]USK45512.1 DNA (cytosine-5-)-methyltransferase [Cytobacillus oceanisediminis]
MIDVVELFAGVGGFRVGLERQGNFNIIWGNQWEPSTKVQHAFNCYAERFKGKGIHSNEDIAKAKYTVPQHDLLVGGFPCQDYSVARSLSGESGIQGKKGVLFWEIMDIVNAKKPMFVLLENVDRLLKSPAKQRGRDFAIMLASFRDAGYSVEWRVINAADYGFAQKRRRVFIFAYRDITNFSKELKSYSFQEIIHEKGFFSSEFPLIGTSPKHSVAADELPKDIVEISDNFNATFRNAGIMRLGQFYTEEVIPDSIKAKTLGEILKEAKQFQTVDKKYFLNEDEVGKNGKTTLEMFQYLKGAKKVERTSSTGHVYTYSEGGMNFPDDLDGPARTMLTSEGTKNRSTHVVRDPDTNQLRLLTPVECELINDFPPNWTEGLPDKARYFCMGNALVVGLIEKMGNKIKELYDKEVTTLERKYTSYINELEMKNATLLKRFAELESQMKNDRPNLTVPINKKQLSNRRLAKVKKVVTKTQKNGQNTNV